MKNKNILITGGTGFIGSFLVERLIKENNVKCLVLKNTDTKVLDTLDVEIAYGNLSNIVSLKNAVKDVDIVFHLAAAFKKDLPKDASEEYYFKINVDGTENLFRVCLENEIQKVIHLSACGVYGHGSDTTINEESPYQPINSYERSKCESEKVALKYSSLGLPTTIIQPTVVYGPRETVAFPRFFKSIKNGTFKIIGNGENKLHLLYVENLIDGTILAAEKRIAIGQRYLMGDKKAYTLLEIAETIASELGVKISKIKIPYQIARIGSVPFEIAGKIMGFKPIISRYTVDFLAKNRVYNISKAKKDLGYNPKISLKGGVEVTAKWYEDNGLL